MKIVYDHSQTAWVILVALVSVILIMSVTTLLVQEFTGLFIALIAIFIVIGVLFYRGRTQISPDAVKYSFGPGLISRTIKLSSIESAIVVRNSPLHGFGIRIIRRGLLYNVSGLEAVEFKLKNGKHIRFGTNDPTGLRQATMTSIIKFQESKI